MIVLAHGLLGFDKLELAGAWLPGVQYWRGIEETLSDRGCRVLTASVPPAASIEERADALSRVISKQAGGERINIIA